ncbi:MAG: hypothetical protein CSB13_01360 [Chloroflexi bacterium]|nr:MAG: hypothetical protein CSB13_01360 [Chloroflexota bacterium]
MGDEKSLVPIEQREVDFYGDTLTAVQAEDGTVYVPIRPICGFLGVSWQGQNRRINEDEVLSEVSMSVNITLTDIKADSRRPKTSKMLCLPLEYINGFLFGINPKRVKPEVKAGLIRYQKECYRVLADAFLLPVTAVSPMDADDQVLMQLHNMALVIANTTREMLETKRLAKDNKRRLDLARGYLQGLNERLDERFTAIEERIPKPSDALTKDQAFEIQERVKRIALALAKHDPSKTHFRAVYDALSLRTHRTSYKDIPQETYEAAISFLDEWLMGLWETDE